MFFSQKKKPSFLKRSGTIARNYEVNLPNDLDEVLRKNEVNSSSEDLKPMAKKSDFNWMSRWKLGSMVRISGL